MTRPASSQPPWRFTTRFRRHAFGWRASRLAIQRLHEAVTEIRGVARHDPLQAAEGAIRLIEKLSPALAQVDSSSGALGTAVNRALEGLVPLIAGAPAEPATRERWLERLFQAQAEDEVPYIETLADHWGALCGSAEVASGWADRLLQSTRQALSPDPSSRGYFHGTSACLSALLRAGRHAELFELLEPERFWPYKRWAVEALLAQGRPDEALALAEACRGPGTPDAAVDRLGEQILLSRGQIEAAYQRYGLTAQRAGTHLATFRAIAKRYPGIPKERILTDLVAASPGAEGKWFATAKEAGLYERALELARRSPCDPKTLTRAARDFAQRQPAFAREAALLAVHWLVQGHGYEITTLDVLDACRQALAVAESLGELATTRNALRALVAAERPRGFVRPILAHELGLT